MTEKKIWGRSNTFIETVKSSFGSLFASSSMTQKYSKNEFYLLND